MSHPVKIPTRSARRRIALTLLVVLAVVGGSAYAVYAATKSDFSLSATPSSQTVVAGNSTSYTVSLSRSGGFAGAVALSASGLPAGASASFSPTTLVSNHDSGTMTVQTGSSTAAGSYTLTVTGTNGGISHTATVTLVVVGPDFSLAASPSLQEISQGESTSYAVTLTRKNGFTGAVSLSVAGLPSDATASWTPSSTIPSNASTATLSVQTAGTTPTGTFTLTVSGSGSLPGGPATRQTSVSLDIGKSKAFPISGNLGTTLYPGTKGALNLSLTNLNNFDLKVTSLTATVREATSKAGCSGSQNFAITQFSGTYPLTIHPGTTALSSLVADSSKWPQVRMLDLPTNQDACRNATITLDYSGSATK
jgi:uncharacterized membrane protein